MCSESKIKLTILIPTLNEEINIFKCLDSLKGLRCSIYVIDTNSVDNTTAIAEKYGVKVFTGNWGSFSEKINWALLNLPINTDWVMRVDADEVLSPKLYDYLQSEKYVNSDFCAYTVIRKINFLGKELNFGGLGNLRDIRIWRHGAASMENRMLDEHMIIKGNIGCVDCDIIDTYRRSIDDWIVKHIKYANLEVQESMSTKLLEGNSSSAAKFKRLIKNKIYYKLPFFVRPLMFFIFRYFILLGFLDGKAGLIYHTFHAFWYRFLVDVKIFEKKIK
jgi:glycosyltransferase involved in cell wall biosynthesis